MTNPVSVWDRDQSAECSELILRDLIEHGAQIAARDSNGQTPLHVAAVLNNLLAARLLLSSGATAMSRDSGGETPLDYAQTSEMMQLLQQYGATKQH